MKQLELMTTQGCHLCDQALPLLVDAVDPDQFQVDLVDIAFDDDLMRLYALNIPVLVDVSTQKRLDWPFDTAQITHFLNGVIDL